MLETSRILLRAVEPEDVDYLFRNENNPEIWELSNTITPFSKNTLLDYAKSIHDIFAQKQFRFMIHLKTENKVIGMVDLFDFDFINSRVGLGIIITDLNERNKGFAEESINLVINYSKKTLFLNQLHCSIFSNNISSIKLFSKLGFQYIGTRKKWHKKSIEEWYDENLYQLIL